MKGVYMVDADRLFVQHFENLLFTNSNEYKMLGHNFKANDFLNKLKERPDLLGKIDLLFVNPKLIDLNGLELIKKVQTFRKDINVCVIVNENMRTFYQNEISELGIENIIIYPNSDEYYLDSVKSIFNKIEHGNNANDSVQSNAVKNSVKMKDEDVFSELNSSDFLKKFDFDSLSDDFFKQPQEEKVSSNANDIQSESYTDSSNESIPNTIGFNNNITINNFGSVENESKINVTQVDLHDVNKEQSFVTPNFGFDNTQETGQSFIVPNFGLDDVQEKEKSYQMDNTETGLFGEPKYQSPSFGDSLPKNNGFAPDLVGDANYNKPIEQAPNYGDFGYNISKSHNSIFENENYNEPEFQKPNFIDNSMDNQRYQENSFGAPGLQNAYGNDFGFNSKSFDEQQDSAFAFEKAENYGNHDNYNSFGYEANTGYSKERKNDFFSANESEIPGNPLDLSAFGVTPDNSHINNLNNYNETSIDNNVNGRDYSDCSPTMTENNIFEGNDMYNNDGFEMPYQNNFNDKQKTNLQNINRPDIDNFTGYGEQGGGESYMPYGSFNDNEGSYKSQNNQGFGNVDRHKGFTQFEYGNNNNNNFSTMNEHQNNDGFKNPYDEYSFNMKNRDAMQENQGFGSQQTQGFGGQQTQGFGGQQTQGFGGQQTQGFGSQQTQGFGGQQSQGFGVDVTSQNNKMEKGQSNRPFGGFDFSKPLSSEERRVSDTNINKTGFGNNFGGGNDLTGFETQTSNKAVIENMYNKTGADTLSYSPMTNTIDSAQPIRHERSHNSTYNEVPDFAKQIVAFYSTKGGIGKTSLAVNSTIQLAKYSKKKICLIDFDVTNANVHTHLGILDSTYDLSVISNFESEIDSFSLSRIITPYRIKDKDGETVEFDVIVGFKEMKMSERFNEKEVHKILSILEEMYDIVVVDTHPVYTDIAISTILKKATKIVFVSEQEMTALNGAKDFILASKKYGIPSEKLFMVLNRYKSQTTIFTKNRIEKSLNKTILATVPADMDHLRDAVNTNNPVSIANPNCELARAYIDVAKIIDPSIIVPEETKGFFKRFKR